MKKAMLFFAFLAIAMAQAAFAQSKACLDERNKANAMKEKCMGINKAQGADEFNKCLEGLKAQVAKANGICEAGNQEPAAVPAVAPAKPVPAPAKAPPKPAPKASQQPPPAQALSTIAIAMAMIAVNTGRMQYAPALTGFGSPANRFWS